MNINKKAALCFCEEIMGVDGVFCNVSFVHLRSGINQVLEFRFLFLVCQTLNMEGQYNRIVIQEHNCNFHSWKLCLETRRSGSRQSKTKGSH